MKNSQKVETYNQGILFLKGLKFSHEIEGIKTEVRGIMSSLPIEKPKGHDRELPDLKSHYEFKKPRLTTDKLLLTWINNKRKVQSVTPTQFYELNCRCV